MLRMHSHEVGNIDTAEHHHPQDESEDYEAVPTKPTGLLPAITDPTAHDVHQGRGYRSSRGLQAVMLVGNLLLATAIKPDRT